MSAQYTHDPGARKTWCDARVSAGGEQEAMERALAALAPIGEADRRRALVIVNPHAATVSERLRNLVIYALAARYEVEAVETLRQGHAIEIARAGGPPRRLARAPRARAPSPPARRSRSHAHHTTSCACRGRGYTGLT